MSQRRDSNVPLFKGSKTTAEYATNRLLEKWRWIEATCVNCSQKFIKRSTARRTVWCEECLANRRDHRKRGHEISARLTKKWKAEGRPCELCGAPGKETHHKVRLADGGSHDESNLIFLCTKCHQQQHYTYTFYNGRGR